MGSNTFKYAILLVACIGLVAVAVGAHDQTTTAPQQEQHQYNYYIFGDDCPDGQCVYTCDSPDCPGINGGMDAPVIADSGVNLEIVDLSRPSRIAAGQEITLQVTVQNRGDQDAEQVVMAVSAYGQTKEREVRYVRAGGQRTFEVPFTVPTDASGPETLQVEAVAYDLYGAFEERDIVSLDVEVDDAYLTMRLSPTRVTVGDLVEIRGMMSTSNMDADLYIGGQHISTITSDPTRQYSHTIKTREPGFHHVELRAGNARETAYLRVDPDIGITNMNVPETANTQDRFDACAAVRTVTPQEVTLRLLVDGREINTQDVVVSGEQEECFRVSIPDPGEHEITLIADAGDASARRTQSMQVVESRIEVNVFPQQITLGPGSGGQFEVAIDNRDAHGRTYNIRVSGLDGIVEQTHQRVSLGRDESSTAIIRVTPPGTGRYSGNVQVTADGVTLADTDITIYSRTDPGMRGPFDRVRRAAAGIAQYVLDRTAFIGTGIAVILGVAAIVLLLRRYNRRRETIEPRY